eukprot:13728650-Heterocapsa_arctica.AAC.1
MNKECSLPASSAAWRSPFGFLGSPDGPLSVLAAALLVFVAFALGRTPVAVFPGLAASAQRP